MTQALRVAGVRVIAPQDHETFTHQILIPLAEGCAGGAALRLGPQYIPRHPRDGQPPIEIAANFAAIFACDDQGLRRLIG